MGYRDLKKAEIEERLDRYRPLVRELTKALDKRLLARLADALDEDPVYVHWALLEATEVKEEVPTLKVAVPAVKLSSSEQDALDYMKLRPGTWVDKPEPRRIGRRSSRPERAYYALVKKGLIETDGKGKFRAI